MELLDQGLSLNEVARILGCGPSSVMRWRNQVRLYGEEGLAARPVPGRPPKLGGDQRDLLRRLILHGAIRNGFETEGWTTTRIAQLIEKKFGVNYHRDHIGRLMASMGFHYVPPLDGSELGNWEEGEPPEDQALPSPGQVRPKPG